MRFVSKSYSVDNSSFWWWSDSLRGWPETWSPWGCSTHGWCLSAAPAVSLSTRLWPWCPAPLAWPHDTPPPRLKHTHTHTFVLLALGLLYCAFFHNNFFCTEACCYSKIINNTALWYSPNTKYLSVSLEVITQNSQTPNRKTPKKNFLNLEFSILSFYEFGKWQQVSMAAHCISSTHSTLCLYALYTSTCSKSFIRYISLLNL